MKLKKIASLVLVLCMGLTMTACGITATVQERCTVEVGKTVKLELLTEDEISAEEFAEKLEQADIVWESADPRIARVDEAGNVTGVSVGETDVTVQAKSLHLETSCHVTVVEPEQEDEPSEQVLLVALNTVGVDGKKALEKVGVTFPEELDANALVWSSSNDEIAKVDAIGIVTPISLGSCIITLTGQLEEEEWTASFQLEVCETVEEQDENAAPLVEQAEESEEDGTKTTGKTTSGTSQKTGSTGATGGGNAGGSNTATQNPTQGTTGSSGTQNNTSTGTGSSSSSSNICPICGYELVNGVCQVIHTYSGYGYCIYDEGSGIVYVVCNSCGGTWPRSSFADVYDFVYQHGIACYNEHHKTYIICQQCGTAFEEGTEPEIMRQTGYCSTACQLASGYYCPVCMSALYIDGCHNCGYGKPEPTPEPPTEQPSNSESQSTPADSTPEGENVAPEIPSGSQDGTPQ